MKTADLEDILRTVETIRVEMHPDLDATFLSDVVKAEEANQEDDAGALRVIQAAAERALTRRGEEAASA
jgi:hypothetical protein